MKKKILKIGDTVFFERITNERGWDVGIIIHIDITSGAMIYLIHSKKYTKILHVPKNDVYAVPNIDGMVNV